jgi:surface polysaccharide O-acyltransferase-like enzyme
MQMEKTNWIDNLRALATISVIILHVAAPILYQYNKVSIDIWWIGNFFDASMRFGVPIFLMITGALILPKTYPISQFLKQRASKIILPFLFWSFVYIIYNLSNSHEISFIETGKYILYKLKNGAAYHLWYIYMLVGIYLFLPIIGKWIVNSTKQEVTYFIVIWLVVMVINLPILLPFKPNINFNYFAGYLGYPVLGYYLAHQIKPNKSNITAVLLIGIGTLITLIGTYFISLSQQAFNSVFYSFLTPNVLITAIGIFLLFKQTTIKSNKINFLIKAISKYSYGIYLSHIFVLLWLSRFKITWDFVHPAIGILTTSALCLTISLLITFMLRKIPFGKHIAG